MNPMTLLMPGQMPPLAATMALYSAMLPPGIRMGISFLARPFPAPVSIGAPATTSALTRSGCMAVHSAASQPPWQLPTMLTAPSGPAMRSTARVMKSRRSASVVSLAALVQLSQSNE